jgi:hypothetical protein
MPTLEQVPALTPAPSPTPAPKPPIGPLAFIDRQKRLSVRDDDGQVCALTAGGTATSPAWSPDGTRLAYSYQAGEGAAAELRVYHLADGTHETIWVDPGLLAPLALPFREIAWAPSGRYVLLSQGCCLSGSIYLLDLEARALVGQYASYEKTIWSPKQDLLALTLPQPVETFIPIESGDSSSIALARPGEITPTLVLTGTQVRMYSAHAWLSADELLVGQNDLDDEGGGGTSGWWAAKIDPATASVLDTRPLERLPLVYDEDGLEAHLAPWLPEAELSDWVWSSDGAWVVFRADLGFKERQIYAFRWDDGPLVGPLGVGTELTLAPVGRAWTCPTEQIVGK